MCKSACICGILITFAVKNHIIKGMKRILLPFALMVAALCMYTSCLKSDSDSDVKYYDDTAITSFSLGTVNRYLHTISKSGEDSVYKTTFAGSAYKFYIDQKNFEIYNPDSLPYGSDAAHLLCTITSKNSGVVVLKNIDNDTLKFFNTSDSLDFSQPRVLRVVSNDGTATRDYTVRVNVHQESAEKVLWTEKLMPTALATQLRSFVSMRLLAAGKRLVLLGSDGNTTQLMTSTDGGDWSLSNAMLGAEVADNAVALGDDVLMVDGAQLKCLKADGSFTPVEGAMAPLRLLAASDSRLYGLAADGAMAVSDDKGLTWAAETLDADLALLHQYRRPAVAAGGQPQPGGRCHRCNGPSVVQNHRRGAGHRLELHRSREWRLSAAAFAGTEGGALRRCRAGSRWQRLRRMQRNRVRAVLCQPRRWHQLAARQPFRFASQFQLLRCVWHDC